MRSKKSQQFALQTIVIAAILLIGLIVLIFILTGKIQVFTSGTRDCVETNRGECRTSCYDESEIVIPGTDCPEGRVCCKQIMGT
ncbi:hypothetical protein GF327_06905 [Candidatus Woesearchaeota archaeon]|nr:hypothetical protein [Candidatus Woesearchaeota archaeon]